MKGKCFGQAIAIFAGFLIAALMYGKPADAAAETEFHIPVGEGETKAAYGEHAKGTDGPTSFCVVEEEVYLLDSVNERIMVYDGDGWVRNIILGFYSNEMKLLNHDLFVVNYFNNEVVRYTLAGEEKETYSLRQIRQEEMGGMIWHEDQLKLTTRSGQVLKYNQQLQMFLLSEGETAEPDKEYSGREIEGHEVITSSLKLGNGYTLVTRSIAKDKLYVEQYLTKEEKDGRIIGYFEIDTSDWSVIPEQYLYIAEDTAYIMLCYEDEIIIREPEFTERFRSRLFEEAGVAFDGKGAVRLQRVSVKNISRASLDRMKLMMLREKIHAIPLG